MEYAQHSSRQTPSISNQIAIDMQKISVGNMANLTRQLYKAGNVKYCPLDPTQISTFIPPAIEAGRLEARMNDFYSKYADLDRSFS
jgi:hypothetical protein